ncbi:MAG TPA: GNAT family N-acetyltransferase [Candidatus Cybelea sp.]|nr:GNAT family N-acetyltransferase [Candidatus Cybelea sp.]
MSELFNLVVDLDRHFPTDSLPGIEIAGPAKPDERTLAWIDATFGGFWSSETAAGVALVARRGEEPVGFATIDPKGLRFAWLDGSSREPGTGIFGPFGVAPAERGRGLGTRLLRAALNALRGRGFARALIPAVTGEALIRYYADTAGARIADRFERPTLYRRRRRVSIMASGNGSNFQAVLDSVRAAELPVEVVALVSNSARAFAVERARDAGIPAHVVPWNRAVEPRNEYDARLLDSARADRPDLVLMLGWMHLLDAAFVRAFPEMLNLHPAFLPLDPQRDSVVMPDGCRMPAFRGPHAVRDALAASSSWVGATLHRVTAETDRGPVMTRAPLRVEPGEEEDSLMERVHELERGVVRAGLMRWLYER